MKSNQAMKITMCFTAFTLVSTSAQAATITYVGFDENVEATANDATSGWRNPTPVKPLDIDGDNILGTDGYRAFNGGAVLQPSYISSWSLTVSGSNWDGNRWGWADNPADPTGSDTLPFGRWQPAAGGNFLSFVITGSDLDGEVLRVGIFYDTLSSNVDVTLGLTQIAGGSASASSPLLDVTNDADGADIAYFDVTGAVAGDAFQIVGTDLGQFGGFTFDSAPAAAPIPEPSTTALLGLGGIALAFRRRRK